MKTYTQEQIDQIAEIIHSYDQVLYALKEIEKEESFYGIDNIPEFKAKELIRYGKSALDSYRYYVPKEVDEKLSKENMGLPTKASKLEGTVSLQEAILEGKPIRI